METYELDENLDRTRESANDHDPVCTSSDLSSESPTITVRGSRNLSISSGGGSSSNSSAGSSPDSSPTSNCDLVRAMDVNHNSRHGRRSPTSNINPKTGNDSNPVLRANFNKIRTRDDDLSNNNNHSSPTMEALRYNRRSLSRSNSKCSSISEDGSETESEPSLTSRLRPLQRGGSIHEDDQVSSPRGGSPIEELETLSGIKTVIRRPGKSQNGRNSPSWRWSVIGYAAGDYDAVTRATHKSPSSVPITTSSSSSTTSSSNGHPSLSRRSSLGLSSAGTNRSTGPTSNVRRMSASFRRLSLQMDMPWRDPNERLVKFADWLIKRTEEIMERSARARQKTYELLRMAKQRQKDRIEY